MTSHLLTLALDIRRERLGDEHPDVARTRSYFDALPEPYRADTRSTAAR